MECKFILLADAVNQSREGKLNITGEFNGIHALKLPVGWPLLYVVARIEASLSEGPEHAGQLKVTDEDGAIVFQSPPLPFRFAKGRLRGMPARADVVASLVGLVFPRFGTYSVTVFVDGIARGETALYVAERTPNQPPGGGPARGKTN